MGPRLRGDDVHFGQDSPPLRDKSKKTLRQGGEAEGMGSLS
ncbi:hypothetical protein MTBUT4_350005 [Magnetospirillum sp. UT-4]|nr:hypothetical protein MTBUT4_350005 [Magnetospirillum sp. UT-4]